MKILLAVLFLLLIGCGSIGSEPWLIVISDSDEIMTPEAYQCDKYYVFSPDLTENIHHAIEGWNNLLGEEKLTLLEGTSTYDNLNYGLPTDGHIFISHSITLDPTKVLGITSHFDPDNYCNCLILLVDLNISWNVTAHEIGHCFGFKHSPTLNSLMYAPYNQMSRFSESLLELLQ